MEYTYKEIERIHDKAYKQGLKHAIEMIEQFPIVLATKSLDNLARETEKKIIELNKEISCQ